MGEPVRDSQRARVYAAEEMLGRVLDEGGTYDLFGSTLVMPRDRRFADLDSIRRYLAQLVRLRAVAEHPRADVAVHVAEYGGHTRAVYEAETATIRFPLVREGTWARRELVVLHEYAHHLTPHLGHGPEFAGAFADLVEHALAPEAATLLRVLFSEHDVAFTPGALTP